MRMLAAALALAGCFIDDLDLRGTMFRCDDGVTCPSGFACNSDHYCVELVDAGVDAPVCGKIDLFRDNFDDGMVDAIWMKVPLGGASVMEQGGEARISLTGGTGAGAYRSVDRADLTSSHVYITVVSVTSGASQTYLRVAADADNYWEIVVENNVISFRQGATTIGFTGYDNVQHRIWQISESGGTIRFQTSDGSTFVDRASTQMAGFADSVILEFGARTTGPITSSTEAHFDNLNGGGSALGPCTRG